MAVTKNATAPDVLSATARLECWQARGGLPLGGRSPARPPGIEAPEAPFAMAAAAGTGLLLMLCCAARFDLDCDHEVERAHWRSPRRPAESG